METSKIKRIYLHAERLWLKFSNELQLLDKGFTFFGFDDGNEPHVDFVHNEIFIIWEAEDETLNMTIENAIDEMDKNGCITPESFYPKIMR